MKILIGYDGSESANASIDDLRRAGLPERGEAIALAVAETWPHLPTVGGNLGPGLDDWMLPALEDARELSIIEVKRASESVAEAVKRVQSILPKWTVSGEAVADAPHWGVIKKADTWKPDLIVAGSHGRSAIGRLVLGSVSHSLLTHARCSVRIGRWSGKWERGPIRIVLGVDGSAGSAAAMSAVQTRQWTPGSEVRVISVIDSSISTALPVEGLAAGWLPVRYESPIQWVTHAAAHVARELKEAGLSAGHEVREGNPRKILVEEAERWNADCIFVGAKGMSRLERFLMGSVSLAVATRAHCSVEVVRQRSDAGPT